MFELIHTSAKQGLIANRSGYCSVAWTEGIPTNLIAPIENLSAYQPLYAPHTPEAKLNPICFAYRKISYGNQVLRVVSRIGFAGLDYSGRSNRIAHHLVFEDRAELDAIEGGAVGVCLDSSNFRSEWNEEPRLLPRRRPGSVKRSLEVANAWKQWAGDAGWAGVVATGFSDGSMHNCYLEFPAHIHASVLLELVGEVAQLLPSNLLDNFTFSTYFNQAPSGGECFLRSCPSGASLLDAGRRLRPQEVISLSKASSIPPSSEQLLFVRIARSGIPLQPPRSVRIADPEPSVATPVDRSVFTIPLVKPPIQQPTKSPEKSSKKSKPRVPETVPTIASANRTEWCRKVVFLIVIIGLLLLVVAGSFWIAEKQRIPKAGSESPAIISETLPASPFQVVAPASEVPPVVSEVAKVTEGDLSITSPPVIPQKAPTASEEMANKPPPVRRKRTMEGTFKMYLDWITGKSDILLPPSIVGVKKLKVEVDKIGNISAQRLDLENFVVQSEDAGTIKLLPARKLQASPEMAASYDPDSDNPNGELVLTLLEKQLKVKDPATHNELTPERANIRCIHFLTPSEDVTWEIGFQNEYLDQITKGKVEVQEDWSLAFKCSDDELTLKDFIEVRVGNLSVDQLADCKLSNLFREWNLGVKAWHARKNNLDKKELKLKQMGASLGCNPDKDPQSKGMDNSQWKAKMSDLDYLFQESIFDPQKYCTLLQELFLEVCQDAYQNRPRAKNRLKDLEDRVTSLLKLNNSKKKKWHVVKNAEYNVSAELGALSDKFIKLRKFIDELTKYERDKSEFKRECILKLKADKMRQELNWIASSATQLFDTELNDLLPIENSEEKRQNLTLTIPVSHKLKKGDWEK